MPTITGRDYVATHPETGVSTHLIRMWRARGKVHVVGRNDRGETLYDLASLARAERDTLMSKAGSGQRRGRVL